MNTKTESSRAKSAVPTEGDLEALRREIAHVQEERRLLLGRVEDKRHAYEPPPRRMAATYASIAVSTFAIVGFVVLVAMNPPRVPPRPILVQIPAASSTNETPLAPVVAPPPAAATPTAIRDPRPGPRRDPRLEGGERGGRHGGVEQLLEGIEEGHDPLGGLSSTRRTHPRTVDDPIGDIE